VNRFMHCSLYGLLEVTTQTGQKERWILWWWWWWWWWWWYIVGRTRENNGGCRNAFLQSSI